MRIRKIKMKIEKWKNRKNAEIEKLGNPGIKKLRNRKSRNQKIEN